MYIMLSTNEHTRLRLICLFGFTVDNGGSQKTERIVNTWRIQLDKRDILLKVLFIIFGSDHIHY